MKSLLLAIALAVGLSAQASTVDNFLLPISGVQTEENFTLNAVQTRTEYRRETVERTCYRTVMDGYRLECRDEPQVICYPSPQHGQVCTTRFERRCYNVPQYRQEAYTCYQTVSVPYEVFNNNAKAIVNVKINNVANLQSANYSCGVNFSLTGNVFKSIANCPEFIVLAKNSNVERQEGNTVVQDRTVELTLLDSDKISAPTKNGISSMRLEGQTLVFKTGDLNKNPNFTLKLFVERRKLLKGDETLINRKLTPSEFSFEKIDEDSGLVKINLSKVFGGINAKRKHVLKVDLNVVVDTTGSINATLPALSATESITVNN